MLFIILVAALLAFLLLVRLPWYVSALLVGLSLSFGLGVLALGGLERARAPTLAYILLIGLAVPANHYVQRSSRVAPPRRRKQMTASGAKQADNASNFEGVDIPGYDLLEKVGSGGMASVYRAKRREDGRIVALKVPMDQYVADAKFIRRFHREAEVAQRLDHENIVHTFEHGSLGSKHYMVMEFVDGRSLESYIEAEELDVGLGIEVMKLVVRALQHIHSAGIIHRDIKPANIMILRGGIQQSEEERLKPDAVKLMDFGIAGGKILSRLTMTGARVGTPVYMSPEQARGLKIDHRSDIYSLGLVFYEMLTGQTAFKGGYEAIVHQQIFQTPPPPRQLNLEVPKALDTLVMRMIAKEPADRPRLEEIYELLDAGAFSETSDGDLASRLVITVSARQGIIRTLDTNGNLHSSLGDIGIGEKRFSAAPLALALAPDGSFYAAVFEYRVGQDENRMLHKLEPSGKLLFSFGSYGMKPGEFLYPVSIAVAPTGTVYVLDSESHLVQYFNAEGDYQGHFGGRGEGKGLFNDPRSVTVGADGSVFVLDYGNKQVQRFDREGRYRMRWAFKLGGEQPGMRLLDGVAVDDAGNLYISDATGGKIRKITPKGKVVLSYAVDPLQGEATDTLIDLGLDDVGYLYAARRGGHLIRKYDLSGRLMATMETYAPLVQMIVDINRQTAISLEDDYSSLRLEP